MRHIGSWSSLLVIFVASPSCWSGDERVEPSNAYTQSPVLAGVDSVDAQVLLSWDDEIAGYVSRRC